MAIWSAVRAVGRDEPEVFRTSRLGLFGLDKLHNIERTLDNLDKALSRVIEATNIR